VERCTLRPAGYYAEGELFPMIFLSLERRLRPKKPPPYNLWKGYAGFLQVAAFFISRDSRRVLSADRSADFQVLVLPFLLLLNFERPTLDGHVPFYEEVFEVFPIDTIVSAGKPESLETVALDPFQYGALAHLAISRDILGSESDVFGTIFRCQSSLLNYVFIFLF
jgi:hypothetical protein